MCSDQGAAKNDRKLPDRIFLPIELYSEVCDLNVFLGRMRS